MPQLAIRWATKNAWQAFNLLVFLAAQTVDSYELRCRYQPPFVFPLRSRGVPKSRIFHKHALYRMLMTLTSFAPRK
jgi:hypothetical protein